MFIRIDLGTDSNGPWKRPTNKDNNIDTISTKNRATRYFSLPLTDFFIMYPFSNKEGRCVSTPAPVSSETADNHDREPLVEINYRRF